MSRELQKINPQTLSLLKVSTGLLTKIPKTSKLAFEQGTQLAVVKKQDAALTRAILLRAVVDVVQAIDAKKTITTDLEMEMLIDEVLEFSWHMKLEEVLLVFKRMCVKGGWFERLKAGDFMDELREYDQNERAELLETRNKGVSFDFLSEMNTEVRASILEAVKTPQNDSVLKTNKRVDFSIDHNKLAELRTEHDKDYQKVVNGKMSKEDYLKKWGE